MENKRTARIILTAEALVLRDLRISNGFSMKKAGDLLGKSDSYIAQIESGRMDLPQGERLEKLLSIYGLKIKSFKERIRHFKPKLTPQDEFKEIVGRLDHQKIQLILNFTKALAANGLLNNQQTFEV